MARHRHRPVDLSRYVRALGPLARAHLDTSRGFPTHHRVTARQLRRLRRALKHPDPAARAAALARLRARVLPQLTRPA